MKRYDGAHATSVFSDLALFYLLILQEASVTEMVVSGLVKRRADAAGEIERIQDRLKELVKDIEALDAVILQFAPTYKIESIVAKAFRPPDDWSKRGEMSRVIMGVLRQATEPLSTRHITDRLMMELNLDRESSSLVYLMRKRVAVSLRDYRDRKLVRSLPVPGMYNLWEVAPSNVAAT